MPFKQKSFLEVKETLKPAAQKHARVDHPQEDVGRGFRHGACGSGAFLSSAADLSLPKLERS